MRVVETYVTAGSGLRITSCVASAVLARTAKKSVERIVILERIFGSAIWRYLSNYGE